jgi:hypothetical protein
LLVAGDDDSVDFSAPLERGDGFDSGSYGRGPALVDAGGHERVQLVQKFFGKPDGNLFGGHRLDHTNLGLKLGFTMPASVWAERASLTWCFDLCRYIPA